MRLTLSENDLVKSMKDYIQSSKYAGELQGYIWTSPTLVEQFITELGEALASTIRAAICPPIEALAEEPDPAPEPEASPPF